MSRVNLHPSGIRSEYVPIEATGRGGSICKHVASHSLCPGDFQHHVNQACWYTFLSPVLRKWRQEDQKLTVTVSNVASSRPTLPTLDPMRRPCLSPTPNPTIRMEGSNSLIRNESVTDNLTMRE